MTRSELIKYIESMFHSCTANPLQLSHKIRDCNDKEKHIGLFIKSYEEKRWTPTIEYAKEEEHEPNS